MVHCVQPLQCCCRGFVEAYREIVCEATFEPGAEAYLAKLKSLVSVQLLCVPAWNDHDCVHMYMFGCLVNSVCMCGLAVVLAFGALQAFTGISLTIDAHLCMAILIFHAMHLTA